MAQVTTQTREIVYTLKLSEDEANFLTSLLGKLHREDSPAVGQQIYYALNRAGANGNAFRVETDTIRVTEVSKS